MITLAVEGYARLIVDPTGSKYLIEESWNGSRKLDICSIALAETLGEQLPKELVDVQVLCVFEYVCVEGYDWYHGVTEYEDSYILISHVVLQHGYMSRWAEEIPEDLALFDGGDGWETFTAGLDSKQIINEWEEFYGQKFQANTKPEVVAE